MRELERTRPAGISRNRFCQLMEINRSTLYYERRGESEENLSIMKEMDCIYTEHPTSGVLSMRDKLSMEGYVVNVKRIRRLMRKMGLEAIYPQKKLTKQGPAKYVHPYLLRNLAIDHSNQVWSTDITYIPMRRGFMYLYAIIDVYSRYVVGWRLSNTLEKENCIELLNECVNRHGAPEIINTDQGSQYTTPDWIQAVKSHDSKVSMDGRGRCKDNIWIERFWRTLKQDYVYRYPTSDVGELREGIEGYIVYYNDSRPHQSLGRGIVPSKIYFLHKAA